MKTLIFYSTKLDALFIHQGPYIIEIEDTIYFWAHHLNGEHVSLNIKDSTFIKDFEYVGYL